jgi:phosphonate transport system ATP-binding protein
MSTTDAHVLIARDLGKTYPDGTEALRGFSVSLAHGQMVAVIGPSGAGKSTFLRCVNRLVEPTTGEIVVNGRTVTGARRRELRLARREIGMVFQHFNLVRRLPVVRNVLHGRLGYTGAVAGALGRFHERDVERALELLERVGLGPQAFKRCDELSGGQMQRVGIARALMQDAAVILADEPIASLDLSSSERVLSELKRVATDDGITTVVNLHQVEYARQFADRIIGMRDGELFCDVEPDELDDATVTELYYGEVPALEDAS